MYAVGNDPGLKARVSGLIQHWVASGEKFMTDAEVFQEILHRYQAIQRLGAIQDAFSVLNGIVDEVLSIEHRDVESAKALLLSEPKLSARDALHVAIMQRHGITQLMSLDAGYDVVPNITRHG